MSLFCFTLSLFRILSKEINAFVLPPLSQWLELHPQQEDETGIARIEKIARYKALLFLFSKISSQGYKITKSFGLLFFQSSDCWSIIETRLLSQAPQSLSEDDLPLFHSLLTQFSSSLRGHHPLPEAAGVATEREGTSTLPALESTIIWCSQIEVELQKRQVLRREQAMQREAQYAEELRREIERMREEQREEIIPRVEEIE
jgi:hypothetical protein